MGIKHVIKGFMIMGGYLNKLIEFLVLPISFMMKTVLAYVILETLGKVGLPPFHLKIMFVLAQIWVLYPLYCMVRRSSRNFWFVWRNKKDE